MTTVETAKAVRADLKAKFPGAKFSVRCSPGGSINVEWVDGPTTAHVDAVIGKYERVSRDQSGEILSGGNLFVFSKRTVSDRVRTFAARLISERFGAAPNKWEGERREYQMCTLIEVRPDGQLLAWNPDQRRTRPRLALVQGGAA